MKRFESWTNHETWFVNLRLGLTTHPEMYDNLELGEIMEVLHEHAYKSIKSDDQFTRDLAIAFLNEVDWRNIAQVILDQLEK